MTDKEQQVTKCWTYLSHLFTIRVTMLRTCRYYRKELERRRNHAQSLLIRSWVFLGTDRTNVCWIKEGCTTLAPKSCFNLPLDVIDYVEDFYGYLLNLHLNWGCLARNQVLDDELNNAPPSCNPPCFRITKPGKYCYMGTRNNNFSNRRHIGQITVTSA